MAKLRPTYAFMRRLEVLSSGKLLLKDSVKAVTVTYNTHGAGSSGVRQFVREELPRIQFRNPETQFVLIKNTKPTPFVDIYWGSGQTVKLDVEGKKSEAIFSELAAVAGVPQEAAQQAERQRAVVNTANFGNARQGRQCICEVPGQRPCPRLVPITDAHHSWHDKNTRES